MDHKELMNEIQKASKLDRQQCSLLLKSLERIFQEESTKMHNIHLEGLGTFITHKHPEFIEENQETHSLVLYPPRITFRFQSEVILSDMQEDIYVNK